MGLALKVGGTLTPPRYRHSHPRCARCHFFETACSVNTFKAASGAAGCSPCPAGSVAPALGATACVCGAGFGGANASVCSLCPNGQYKSIDGNAACVACPANTTTGTTGATALTQCLCNSGYSGSPGGPCNRTSIMGKLIGSRKHNETGRFQPRPTPPRLCVRTHPGPALAPTPALLSHRPQPCSRTHPSPALAPLLTPLIARAVCCMPAVCAVGSYSTALGAAQCTACPNNTVTASAGATTVNACTCLPGYQGSNGTACAGASLGIPCNRAQVGPSPSN